MPNLTHRREAAMSRRIDPARSIVRVGDGRGFVVLHRHRRLFRDRNGEWKSLKRPQSLIITAAHCLPAFPPCHGASYTEERTYPNLIGPLCEAPSVWAECLFADPIADIAVLGEPDGQALYDECNAYAALIEELPALRMSDPKEHASPAWLLSLDQQWLACEVWHMGSSSAWHIHKAAKPGIQGGMSGSPIFNHDRTAVIGVVCLSTETTEGSSEGGPNPRLAVNLPTWLAPRAAPITAPLWSRAEVF